MDAVPTELGNEEPNPRETQQFPPLPVELVRQCIEMAADDTATAVALARVCKSFNDWIIPSLYHAVNLPTVRQCRSFYRTLITTTTAAPASVRRLASISGWRDVNDGYRLRFIQDIIPFCTRLEALALEEFELKLIVSPRDMYLSTSRWPAVATLLIYKLHSEWTTTPQSLNHQIIQNVTRLHLCEFDVAQLLLLPRLTHLGYYYRNFRGCNSNFSNAIRHLLSNSATLVMFVVETCVADEDLTRADPRRQLAQILDERLFVGIASPQESIVGHFQALFFSGDTWWEDAAVRYKNWRGGAVAEPQ